MDEKKNPFANSEGSLFGDDHITPVYKTEPVTLEQFQKQIEFLKEQMNREPQAPIKIISYEEYLNNCKELKQ